MKDRALGIWLIVMFGVSGLAVIVLAWLWPTLQSDRIITTFAGLVGVVIAVVRGLTLRESPGDKQAPVEVEVENKS